MKFPEEMEFTAKISDIVQALKAESLTGGEGAAARHDLVGEAHATFGGDTSGFGGEDSGPGHQKVMITHDATP